MKTVNVIHVSAMTSQVHNSRKKEFIYDNTDKINFDLVHPYYKNYRCKKKTCKCDIRKMCKGKWNKYQKDVFKHLHLKFKDTY